jgi:phage shock protein A
MGIFQKLSQLLRSNINDAIARAENPEKMLNQVLIDMREQLAKAKQEVAVAIADERKLKAQMEEEHKLSNDWEHRAVLAVRENRDDLAKQALLRQQEHGERALTLQETWQRQNQETERLKEALRQLNDKIEEAKRKKNLLIAKQKRAQAQKRIHETMAGLSDRSAFETFDRMAEKIEETERRALAAAEVSESLGGDQLEREFDALKPASENVEFRLLQLKERMGLPAGGAERAVLPGNANARESVAAKQLNKGNGQEEELVKEAELEE